jgi:hypothetical protein
MGRVEEALGTLVWIVAGVAAIVAIFTLAATGRSYREIGGAGPARDDEGSARCAIADRDAEIRGPRDRAQRSADACRRRTARRRGRDRAPPS